MRKLFIAAALAAAAVPAAAMATPGNGHGDSSAGGTPSPSQVCRAERTAMGTATFKTTYGTNQNRSNAFGKCVSHQVTEQSADAKNAAKDCRAQQQDLNFAAGHGGKTFAQFYGTNANGKNAFGKCVSAKAKAAAAKQEKDEVNAAKQCRTERAADTAAFKAKYGTNHNKSNAFGKCVSAKAKAQASS